MTEAPQFLVVEYDGKGLPFVDWAHQHKGVQFDMILEPIQAAGAGLNMPAVALVRGLDASAYLGLEELLDDKYSPRSTIRRDPRRGEWLGRLTIHVENMKSGAARAVARHANRFGPPWSHVDDGVVYMRMRLAEETDAIQLVADIQAALAAVGAEAHVSVESYSRHDYSVWDRLVQASIGLSS